MTRRMGLRDNICPEAVQILEEHGYVLKPGVSPRFVETRKVGHESTEEYRRREVDEITYEDLDSMGLVYTKGRRNVSADFERQKDRALTQLSRRIKEYSGGKFT